MQYASFRVHGVSDLTDFNDSQDPKLRGLSRRRFRESDFIFALLLLRPSLFSFLSLSPERESSGNCSPVERRNELTPEDLSNNFTSRASETRKTVETLIPFLARRFRSTHRQKGQR